MLLGQNGYNNFMQSNATIVAVILILKNMQLVSLISVDMVTKNLKSIFHVEAFVTLFPALKVKSVFPKTTHADMLITFGIVQLANMMVFYAYHIALKHLPFLSFL